MTDELDGRLRAALEPTSADHARADSLVDEVLAGAHHTGGASPRGTWLLPAAAAAAALVLAVGVALPGALGAHDEAPAAPPSADRRPDGTEYVAAQTWQETHFPDMAPFSSALLRSPLIAVRSAPWCPACGGGEFLPPILASAAAQPHVRFIVVVPRAPADDVGRWNADAPANVRVVTGHDEAPLPGESRPDASSTPALVRLSRLGAVTATAYGRDDVEAALVPPSAPQVLTVRCRDGAVSVDRDSVTAAPDGVHVRAVNETGREVDLRFGPGAWEEPGGAYPRVAPGGTQEQVRGLPPGRTTIRCDGDPSSTPAPHGRRVRPASEATFTVADPGGFWRGTAAEAGCPLGGLASWIGGPGRGRTPAEAAAAWPSHLPDGTTPLSERAGYAVRPAAVGYLEADSQFFVVEDHGRAETLLRTYRTDDGGGVEAVPEWICKGAL